MDGANVGMIKRRGGLSLALKAVQGRRIGGNSSGRNFRATLRFNLTSSAR